MFFQIVFVSLALLAFGAIVGAAGFRLFVILLPVFGFFAGFLVTAQAIQQLFGGGFLATVASWVFAFFVGLIFAVAAYFFYYAAITILAATVGYELGVGLIAGLGISSGVLQFIIGLVVALGLAAVVVVFNLPKVFIVVLTALAGAGMVLSGVLIALGRIPLTALRYGIIGDFIRLSWFWSLVFLVLAAVGVAVQLLAPAGYRLEPYGDERLAEQEPVGAPPVTAPAPGDSGAGPEGVPAT
jgi:hypothetical protein